MIGLPLSHFHQSRTDKKVAASTPAFIPLELFHGVMMHPPRLVLFARPLQQLRPLANQALVGNVDDRGGLGASRAWGHRGRKNRPGSRNRSITEMTSSAETLATSTSRDSFCGRRTIRPSAETSVRLRKTISATLVGPTCLGGAFGRGRSSSAMISSRWSRQVLQTADLLVIVDVDLASSTIRLPHVPKPHQGVLQNRELVGVVPKVVEEPVDQAIADLSRNRAFDGVPQLLAAHPRNEIQALVDRIGKFRKLRSIPRNSARIVSTT